MTRPVPPGARGRLEQRVLAEHSAERFGNLAVRVLATPVLCHWFESACVLAVSEGLDPGEATVGTRLSIEHFKATPLGMMVRVEAVVTGGEGRRLAFAVEAHDEAELVARGTHERFVVDLGRFLKAVEAKAVTTR